MLYNQSNTPLETFTSLITGEGHPVDEIDYAKGSLVVVDNTEANFDTPNEDIQTHVDTSIKINNIVNGNVDKVFNITYRRLSIVYQMTLLLNQMKAESSDKQYIIIDVDLSSESTTTEDVINALTSEFNYYGINEFLQFDQYESPITNVLGVHGKLKEIVNSNGKHSIAFYVYLDNPDALLNLIYNDLDASDLKDDTSIYGSSGEANAIGFYLSVKDPMGHIYGE